VAKPARKLYGGSKIWGRLKCRILGEQQYFVWDTAFQSAKWLDILKIVGTWTLGPPWLRLWPLHGPQQSRRAWHYRTKFSLSSKFSTNLGSMPKTSTHVLSTSKAYDRVLSWKALGSIVAGVRSWRPPVAGCKVVVYLLRSLCRVRVVGVISQPFKWVLDSEKGVCCLHVSS